MIKRIMKENFSEFGDKIEYAKDTFIKILPFVKMPFHDFDRYKQYGDSGIFLIDYIGDEYCLYHLYHLSQGDGTLRATLVLPSSWEKRFEIIEESIVNLKEWFLNEDSSERFIIQSLEYGEIEYFPTLSHYLIPTIIRNGFRPKYRMYMKRAKGQELRSGDNGLDGYSLHDYSSNMFSSVMDYYFSAKNDSQSYFTNCTKEELEGLLKEEFTIKHSKFVMDDSGKIVAGIIPSIDDDKIWIDNFMVLEEYDNNTIPSYMLEKALESILADGDEDVYIYINRDCHKEVAVCNDYGFRAFEFWTDMILER
jgi:hypothetical protein